MGTTLIVWPVLGRVLAPAALGQLSGVLAASSILAPVITLGTHLHVANRLARDPARAKGADGRLVRTILGILIALAAASIVGLACTRGIVPLQITAIVTSTACSILAVGVARGLDRAAFFAVLTIWSQFLALLLLTVVAALSGSLDAGIATYASALVLGSVVVLPLVKAGSDPASSERPREIALRSVHLVPHLVLAVATLLLARIVVGIVSGPVGLAGFQYASLLIGGVTTIGASLDAHWSIRAQSAGNEQALADVLGRNLIRIQAMLIVVAAGVVFFVVVLLPVWLPPGYEVAAVRSAVLVSLSAGAFQALADNRSAALMWLGRSASVSAATTVGVAIGTVSCFAFVSAFGWEAAGAAIALGTAARALVTVLLLRHAAPHLRLTGRSVAVTAVSITLVVLPIVLTQI